MSDKVVPDYNDLARVLGELRENKQVVLTNGCFDLLHLGHVRMIQAAAREGDLLVVALNTDESASRNKGPERPVVTLADRMEIIAAIEGVDFVTSFGEPTAEELLGALRPEVHAKGTDWTEDTVPEAGVVKAYGGRVVICGNPKTRSSSQLIERMSPPD